MVTFEDFKYELAYIVRKRLEDKTLPKNGDLIKSGNHYFQISWDGAIPSTLYDKLICEKKIPSQALESMEAAQIYLNNVVDTFTANLSACDPFMLRDRDVKLGDLAEWEYVKKVPKSYTGSSFNP